MIHQLARFVIGDGPYPFGEVELDCCPRIGEHVVSKQYDNCALWRVVMVMHYNRTIGTTLIVIPAQFGKTKERYDEFKTT